MAEESKKKLLVGEVISDKMDKTIVVTVHRTLTHPFFKKIIRKSKKFKVHDENGEAKIGDLVEIYEGRPLSKTKYMYLNKVLKNNTLV
ncbi:30S ribosomal protein S17 [candidate division TM6 bacterium RIFCSPHIGHO2_12_FULL_32_22]|nr:MAG: 30S ribosomal protein S17 [candidate division TM6 bacterium RIFCSPHIGHO2_12_FULL_32_22]